MKGIQSKKHEAFTGFRDNMLSAVRSYWKWLVCPLFLIFLCIYQIHAANSTAGSTERVERLNIVRIPITAERLGEWYRTAGILTQKREEGKISIPARTLHELIEWGRNNTDVIKHACSIRKPEIFLGVAISIEHARRNLRDVVEYEMRLDEAERITDDLRGVADWIPISSPSPPSLEDWEQGDLDVYEENEIMVGNALEELIPDLPLLVPAWYESEENPGDEMCKKLGVGTRRLTWKVTNGSSGGPKVRRTK